MVDQYGISSLEAVIILGVTVSVSGISGSMLGSAYLDRRMLQYNEGFNQHVITSVELEKLRSYEANRIIAFTCIIGTIAALLGFSISQFVIFILFLSIMDFFLLM